MANRERPRDRGARRAHEALSLLGRDARAARIAADLTQEAVASVLRLDRTWISRFELGDAPGISLTHVFEILAVLGLDASVRSYPAGDPIRDAGQARLLERLHLRLPPAVGWETEVPMPTMGDLRAWDGLLRLGQERWGVEAETRIGDLQARLRSLQLKRRDGGVDGVILLLNDSRHHRSLVREHRALLLGVCPADGQEALEAIEAGRPPRGDALILL